MRRFRTGWLTGGLHVFILWLALEAESSEAWPPALAAMAVVSFFAWMANYRRYRHVHDLPTSKVASAAQGYVELFGKSGCIPDSPVMAPLSSTPCCWYSYSVSEKTSDNKWRTVDSGESLAHFLLVDDTGECVISPDGAEICYTQTKSWTQGDRRYTEELLLPQGHLYALGEFRTAGGANVELDEKSDVSALITEWKKDQPRLIARFDDDKSGTLDLREWEQARLEAQREVRKRHGEIGARDGVHLMVKPRDGRAFIIAGDVPEKIGRRYALWSWAHLVFFFAAGTASLLLFGTVKTP